MTTKLLADEINLPITTGTATSFSSATVVRLVNTDTSARIVTVVETQGGAGIGSMTMPGGSVELLVKTADDLIHVTGGTVQVTKVGFTN